jgi:hypothetical protein
MTLTMNMHVAFVNVQQMKYVIGSGKAEFIVDKLIYGGRGGIPL